MGLLFEKDLPGEDDMPYDIFDDEKEDEKDWLDEKEDWEV